MGADRPIQFLIPFQESKREETSGAIRDLGRKRKILVNKLKTGITRDEGDSGFVGLGVELDSGLGIFDAFFASFSMILVIEGLALQMSLSKFLLDWRRDFLIAVLMAMRHPKSIVLSGALSALFVMTVLFIGLGRIVPNLILRKHTNSATTVLYAFFGLRLLYVAWRSDSKTSQKKEMEELKRWRRNLKLDKGRRRSDNSFLDSVLQFFWRFVFVLAS
ncbi:hypothetical protein ACH5RR_016160 [Cinchona calisaya]|uniref:GDT1 family protein n=1 Tax=Cinchona calisaya TaxID=153742 RepID=A0ABD2ZV80_9GENT